MRPKRQAFGINQDLPFVTAMIEVNSTGSLPLCCAATGCWCTTAGCRSVTLFRMVADVDGAERYVVYHAEHRSDPRTRSTGL